MSCATRFLGIPMGFHHWRREVTGADIITARETDMWARPVYRDYIRCDTRKVCDTCGAVRHRVSCMCDRSRGEQCAIRLDFLAGKNAPR